MSTTSDLDPTRHEPTGEQLFFVMSAAFAVVVVAIIGAAFLPVGAGVALVFAVLTVALVAVGTFLGRLLGDG
jgi:hypothetical protein